MKLFLHNTADLRSGRGQSLEQILTNLGVHVLPAEPGLVLDPMNFDAALVRGGTKDPQMTYLIALALAKQKPVFYLLPKGEQIEDWLMQLRQEITMSPLIFTAYFTPATLERDVADMLNKRDSSSLREIPSIKFTLRITPSMERYLQWKSKQIDMSKADFLRQVMQDEIIAKDKDYRDS